MRFYTKHLENHILPLLGDRALASISRKDCRLLVTTVRERGLAIATVRGTIRTLSVVLSQAVEDEHVSANPALSMRRDEVGIALATALEHFPEWHAWLLCAFRTGLRAGELLGLQWDDKLETIRKVRRALHSS